MPITRNLNDFLLSIQIHGVILEHMFEILKSRKDGWFKPTEEKKFTLLKRKLQIRLYTRIFSTDINVYVQCMVVLCVGHQDLNSYFPKKLRKKLGLMFMYLCVPSS